MISPRFLKLVLIIVLVMAKSKQGEKIFTKENVSNEQLKKAP